MEINGYSGLRSIGAGATSEVYEAIETSSGIKCALKRFNAFVSIDPASRQRIDLEYQTLKKLNHKNIVRVEGLFEDEKNFGLKLELVEGVSLTDWNKQYDWPLLEPKLHVLAQIARALGAAHASQILHRDLKPENVLISNAGEVKLTDFGLARSLTRVTMTKSGLLIGSLAYMAPEVIALDDASVASDLYSFGMIAYELLTGKPPYLAETPQGLIRQMELQKIADPAQLNPTIPERVSALILASLSRDPAQRPKSSWHVEAELMTTLFESGLIDVSLKWVSIEYRNNSDHALEAALTLKNTELKRRFQNSQIKSETLRYLNEMKVLFPQDSDLPKMLSSFLGTAAENPSKERASSYKRRLFLLSLLLLFLSGAAAFWKSQTGDSDNAQTISEPNSPLPTSNHAAQKLPAPTRVNLKSPETGAQAIVARQSEQIPSYGFMHFRVPDEVDVFVGGQYVSPSRRTNLKVDTGKHLVKMVMEGYLPIENTVTVKPGKTTVVNAGGSK